MSKTHKLIARSTELDRIHAQVARIYASLKALQESEVLSDNAKGAFKGAASDVYRGICIIENEREL